MGPGLVLKEPASLADKLACPADDGKAVPADLAAGAAKILAGVKPPMQGAAIASAATTLYQQNPKARPADVANALIASYCRTVAQVKTSVAEQNALLNQFAGQAVQTLQLLPPRKTVEEAAPAVPAPAAPAKKK